VYLPIIVGGVFRDSSPLEFGSIGLRQGGRSYIGSFYGTTVLSFNYFLFGGYTIINSITDAPADVSWSQYEWLSQNVKSSTSGTYKVLVFNYGGTFDLYSIRPQGLANDYGNSLIIFNTNQDVFITKTYDGRQFGSSILAPFSRVTIMDNAGFIDGFIIAKELQDSGLFVGLLAINGYGYKGPLSCARWLNKNN
jgi:hypothetical protein